MVFTQVLSLLSTGPRTARQIAEEMGAQPNYVLNRIAVLRGEGFVGVATRRRLHRTGAESVVWRLTDKGEHIVSRCPTTRLEALELCPITVRGGARKRLPDGAIDDLVREALIELKRARISEIAKRIQAGRSAVRKACVRLEKIGTLKICRQYGAVLVEMSIDAPSTL